MASKTTINFDDEMEAALDELAAIDGTKRLAIKRSLLAEVKRRRRSQAILDLIASWVLGGDRRRRPIHRRR